MVFLNNSAFSRTQPPQASSNSKAAQHTPKTRPGLALDTSFSRHRGQEPKQVFPHRTNPTELSFVSLQDVEALRKKKNKTSSNGEESKETLDNSTYVRPGPSRTVSEDTQRGCSTSQIVRPRSNIAAVLEYTPRVDQTQDSLQTPAVHKRIKGLRPSPLDLCADVSPYDRAIPIGFSVPSATLHGRIQGPQNHLRQRHSPRNEDSSQPRAQDAVTPTIVITPAKDDFEFGSSLDEMNDAFNRPPSSVYSRHTNCMPHTARFEQTPPVPPIPLFAAKPGDRRDVIETRSAATPFRDDAAQRSTPLSVRTRDDNVLSVFTVFEEDTVKASETSRESRKAVTQSLLPTPRASRGWWNIITSPFSSRSNAFFIRSPFLPAEGTEDLLRNAEDMGRSEDPHAGVIFTNRALGDEELRSAPPKDSRTVSIDLAVPRLQRSDTAPAAFKAGPDSVDIHHIPTTGEAAAYYDPNRHFPSLLISDAGRGLDDLEGWSPSQSVYRGSRMGTERAQVDDDSNEITPIDDDAQQEACANEEESRSIGDEQADNANGNLVEGGPTVDMAIVTSPFDDAHEADYQEVNGAQPAGERAIFSTPAESELSSPPPTIPNRNETLQSHFSPLSATPVIEDAHVATFMGPKSSNGEGREVEVEKMRTPSPVGLGAATMASRDIDDGPAAFVDEKPVFQPTHHTRNESRGLGIVEEDADNTLFPPPAPISEKPKLGTDRFGQVRIDTGEPKEPRRPWYRRFFWSIAAFGAALLALLVVLLVMYVPQEHDDMPVQEQWLNLTGFPAIPTGIATVIQPHNVEEVSECVNPQSLWSCSVPSREQSVDTTVVPNFRFEIRFKNQTESTINSTSLQPAVERRSAGFAARASEIVKRSAWSSYLFTPSPKPPSTSDQIFIGRTTDHVSAPYDGEETPFYISLLDPSDLQPARPNRLSKREDKAFHYPYPSSSSENTSPSSGSSDANTAAPSDVPAPALRDSGKPAPTELYPFAYAQPLRLFNRGQDTESYGFYTYFDRSLFVSSISNTTNSTGLGAHVQANVPLAAASAVCTWSQTRLLVQIWTRKPAAVAFPNGTTDDMDVPAGNSTANDMRAPGSFPYAVTVTLDRHGGDASEKGVYCYGLDGDHDVMTEAKVWVDEDRGFGGTLVNPAQVPGNNGTRTQKRGSGEDGGIDGGTGGCSCRWQNWSS